jgi:phosphoribosylformylglycinamidine cyclo-ligase
VAPAPTASPSPHHASTYAEAGVDTAAGDLAIELMKSSVRATQGPEVVGGIGGFAGLYDASALVGMKRPLLATSTDGVGTKVAIAQAIDKHDTIGHDLVGMVVDDIVVVGAKPLFMTDYIATGKVFPERIADIVRGIAEACSLTGTALVGGEIAEHPGLLGPHDYDVAGAATGVVDGEAILGAERVRAGDAVIALASSGIHANGYSLVRHIIARAGISYGDHAPDFGATWGETLLEPTRLYTTPLLQLIERIGDGVHALSHVTGGGIAANLARVLPYGTWTEVDRSTWAPSPVFRVLNDIAGTSLASSEGTWNMGIGFLAVVAADRAADAIRQIEDAGIPAWQVGVVQQGALPEGGEEFEQGAKGVDGGAVRLVSAYAESARGSVRGE